MAGTDDLLASTATLQQVTALVTLPTVPPSLGQHVLPQLSELLHPRQDPTLLVAALQASAHVAVGATPAGAQQLCAQLQALVHVRTTAACSAAECTLHSLRQQCITLAPPEVHIPAMHAYRIACLRDHCSAFQLLHIGFAG